MASRLTLLGLCANAATVLAKTGKEPWVYTWHGSIPRFYETANEDWFAFSEALAASFHLIVIVAQIVMLYYCNYILEVSFDSSEELAARLNPIYKWEALLFAPVTALWLLSGHQVGIWVLTPALAMRIFWYVKKRQGIDVSAREPQDDTAFRTMLMQVFHAISSIIVGGRLYWPKVQLDMSHMDITSEYFYLGAQGVSSIAFLIVWFYMPTFCFKLFSHFLGEGLEGQRKKYD